MTRMSTGNSFRLHKQQLKIAIHSRFETQNSSNESYVLLAHQEPRRDVCFAAWFVFIERVYSNHLTVCGKVLASLTTSLSNLEGQLLFYKV